MKFTIPTKVLSEALRVVSVAIQGGKSTLPILGNVKICAENDQVSFSASNLDIFVTQHSPAKVSSPGGTTVAFSFLSRLTSRMKSVNAEIEASKKNLIFTCGDVTANLETLPVEEFPPPLEKPSEFKLFKAEDLLQPFKLLSHAVSPPDASRYILTGINVCPGNNGNCDFTATNSARLLTYSGIGITKENVIVPDQFVRAFLGIDPEGDIQIGIGHGAIAVESAEVEISSKLIEGTYPNWKTVIPEKVAKGFGCRREDMINALKTCLIFTERQLPRVYFEGKGKQIEVSQPGKAKVMVLGTELEDQPAFAVAINGNFLIESLSVLKSDLLRMETTATRSALMIEDGPLKIIINKLTSEK